MIAVEQRIVDCEQGSGAWLQARLGCVTASRVAALAKPKLEPYKKLKYELATELLTGRATEHYVTPAMENGKKLEPIARAEYEVRFGFDVEQIGLIYHPTIARSGASPDGVVATGGLLEIKCPKPETHMEYLDRDEIPEKYLPQMTWQLACYETQPWNDFVSYCPDMPEKYQIFRKRLERTKEVDALIRGMEAEVVQFNSEVDELLRRIKGA